MYDINNYYNNFPLTCDSSTMYAMIEKYCHNNIRKMMSNEIEMRHKSMKMNIRQVQIVLPTFNAFNSFFFSILK